MVAGRNAFPLYDKPFYGKQKFVRCGASEIGIHCVCLQLGEAEQATISATGESVYKCDACAKLLSSSSNVKSPAKPPESLLRHGATICASSNEETSLLNSVSSQLEAIRNSGQCTIDLTQSLVNMVINLTKEVTDIKNDNTLLKQEIKNLRSLIEASSRPTSQYITSEQRFLPTEMSHKKAASIQSVPSAALPAEALPAILYLLGRSCCAETLLLLEFHPLDLQRYLTLTDLKLLLTERRPPPKFLQNCCC
jgi:hypothetical protein